MLTDILPGRYRKAVYALYALVGVVLGAIQVAYLNIAGQPTWLTVALAVFGFVGTALGATAASNVTQAADVATGAQLEAQRQVLARVDASVAALHEQVATLPRTLTAKPAKKAAPKKPTG